METADCEVGAMNSKVRLSARARRFDKYKDVGQVKVIHIVGFHGFTSYSGMRLNPEPVSCQ
jgi:hypothetical protein